MRSSAGMALVGFAGLLTALTALTGCQTPRSANAASPPTLAMARRPAPSGSIRQSSAYREATRRYRAKDYQGALTLLDRLNAQSLPNADRAFLKRQRELCLTALHPQPGVSGKTPGATPTRRASTISASDPVDCGPRALLLLCHKMGVNTDLASLRKAAGTTKDGTSLEGLSKAATSVGLAAQGVQMDRDALSHLSTPAIAWNNGNHYIAVLGVHQRLWDGATVATIHDPNHQNEEEIPQADLLSKSGGILLTLTKTQRR